MSRKKAWPFTFYLFMRKVNHSNMIFYFDILHETYPELGLFKCSREFLKCKICDTNFTKKRQSKNHKQEFQSIVRKRSHSNVNFALRHFHKKYVAVNPVMKEKIHINTIFAWQVSQLDKTHSYMEFMRRRSSLNMNFVMFFPKKCNYKHTQAISS